MTKRLWTILWLCSPGGGRSCPEVFRLVVSQFAPRIGRFARLRGYSFVRVRDQCKAMEQTVSVSLWISLAVADGTGWQKMRGMWGDCEMTASLAVHSKRTWQDLKVFLKLQALELFFCFGFFQMFSLLSLCFLLCLSGLESEQIWRKIIKICCFFCPFNELFRNHCNVNLPNKPQHRTKQLVGEKQVKQKQTEYFKIRELKKQKEKINYPDTVSNLHRKNIVKMTIFLRVRRELTRFVIILMVQTCGLSLRFPDCS